MSGRELHDHALDHDLAPRSLLSVPPDALVRWATEQLAAAGVTVVGPGGPVRRRHWSIVVPLATSGGLMWAKQNAAGTWFEAGLLTVLGAVAPDAVQVPVVCDGATGWFVTADGGPTMRDGGGALDEAAWHRVARRHAELQRRLTGHVEAALAAGVPDLRSAGALTATFTAAVRVAGEPLHGVHRLSEGEQESLSTLTAHLSRWAALVERAGPPSTIEHNDVHLGNVFARDGRLFDWGDTVVTSPLLGLAPLLGSARETFHGRDGLGDLIAALSATFLDGWPEHGGAGGLARAASAAGVLAHLPRAHSWLVQAPAARADYPAVLPDRLRMLGRAATALLAAPPRP